MWLLLGDAFRDKIELPFNLVRAIEWILMFIEELSFAI